MSYATPWPRVYPNISTSPPSTIKRLTIEFPVTEANLILSVSCNPAIFSLICQTALNNAASYVRTNALTFADGQQLVDFIRQRSDSQSVREAGQPDESTGTHSVLSGTQDLAEKPASTGPTPPSGSGGEGKRDRREKIREAVRKSREAKS